MGIFNLFKKNDITSRQAPIGASSYLLNRNEYDLNNVDLEQHNIRLSDLNKLLRDSHIYSCFQARKSGVLKMKYEILTDNSDYKELIESQISKFDMRKIVSEMLDAVAFGFKPIELFWFLENDKIVLVDLVGKDPSDFYYDVNGSLYFKGNDKPLHKKKFLVLTNEASYNKPYGVPVLSMCYVPYVYKKGTLKLFGEFVQKYTLPPLLGKSSIDADFNSLKDFHDMLKSFQQGMAMVFPNSYDVSSLDFEKSSAKDLFMSFINFCNSEISKSVLSQTLTTEVGDVGSYAAGKVHLDVKQDVVDNDKTMIENAFNLLIRWIIDFNYSGVTKYPIFRLYKEEDVDMTLAQRDAILKEMINFTPSYFQKNYGLVPGDDFEVKQGKEFAEKTRFNPLDKFSEHAQKIINLCLAEIEKGNSFNEIEENILELFPNLTDLEFEKYLETALTLSLQMGFIDGNKQTNI